MLEKFISYSQARQLYDDDDKILLAISGGVDSVCLAALFHQVNASFAMAHCNFQLRGQDSEGDQAFVKNLAKKYDVPFHTINFDTEAYVNEEAFSIQMAARKLRYDWFYEIIGAHGYTKLATAHHLNDSLETTLFNLAKG